MSENLLQHHNQQGFPTEAEQNRDGDQEQKSLREMFKSWLPANSNTFLFEVIAVIYLIIGLIHFGRTGDTSMLTTLLTYAAGYVGLIEVKPLFSLRKKR